jgi:glycerophosphoryl diester phosphodiesterase
MKIYAHRGASKDYPEMSREAYLEAVVQGADGFECDLRMTKDRRLICWHDSNTLRMTGINQKIASSTFADLAFAEPILFSELLDIAITNKKSLALETKHPVPTGGAVERELLRQLDLAKPNIDIAIMSFSKMAISRVKNRYKSVFLTTNFFAAKSSKTPVVGPGLALLKAHPEIVEIAHAKGQEVYVWTVNDPRDVNFCAEVGVDVIMSDIPAQVRKALGYS